MSVGIRQEPEKDMDKQFKPKSSRRKSRKILKKWQNKKFRRKTKLNPEAGPMPKYCGYEW